MAKMALYAAKVPFYVARMQVGILQMTGGSAFSPDNKRVSLSVFSDAPDVPLRCMMSRLCLCIRCFNSLYKIFCLYPSRFHAVLICCMSDDCCETWRFHASFTSCKMWCLWFPCGVTVNRHPISSWQCPDSVSCLR